ncbi:RNA polymerase sigma factor (sigma-70 family) [Haloactinopolyspora alba]|uniref:RNA polymerase sigma factor (Sigma-70 family) n=1 Tax=Haloactinopolyspora alba TaxID=648780 RepID=A0A2P8E2N9_9ACTN|nr:sigma-70 family RNA polymerase sigma factor [Haloactinopolyspora alba]PSL03713.1 RNA polymerase sigma factor (sigma-70 family) [Haloactinopolyspora alba]
MGDPSTSELVKQAADGVQDAWDRLVEQHSALVWTVVRSHQLRTGDAEDAFQATWLRLLENVDRIDRPDRLAGWLVTTARRECLRVLRRTDRERPDVAVEEHAGADTGTPGPVDALLTREDHVEVRRAFDQLSARCQNVLRLTVAAPEQDAYEDVADALGMPVGSIGPTRKRCLQHLRRLLGDDARPGRQTKGD